MTPKEVAECFAVDPKTVTRWAREGVIRSTMTPGKHRRFRESDVRRLMEFEGPPEAAAIESEERRGAGGQAGDARA